jgi:hypothetical protein
MNGSVASAPARMRNEGDIDGRSANLFCLVKPGLEMALLASTTAYGATRKAEISEPNSRSAPNSVPSAGDPFPSEVSPERSFAVAPAIGRVGWN